MVGMVVVVVLVVVGMAVWAWVLLCSRRENMSASMVGSAGAIYKWVCGASVSPGFTTIPQQYLPGSCRG